MGRRPNTHNHALASLLQTHGMSHKRLAFRVNELAQDHGLSTAYKHSSVARWLKGQRPKEPIPNLVVAALSERVGRPVTLEEIGMDRRDENSAGWAFPRDLAEALDGVRAHWSHDQPSTETDFIPGGYASAVTRWLAMPTDPTGPTKHSAPTEVGQPELDELREAAEHARVWDARFGGGDWRLASVTRCLRDRALPLLTAAHTDAIGRQLLTTTAELCRVLAWAAFDTGHSGTAQQHFIQALRLARAGSDVETGAYVLTTMSLHSTLEDEPDQALDMAQGAFEHGRKRASRRVLAFAKLAEARAYGRLSDATSASSALSRAERLLDTANPTNDPPWISYVTHSRLAADATEIFRDLHNPTAALRWNEQASTCTTRENSPRAAGLRQAIAATACCQAGDLDHAVQYANQARTTLKRVSSARASLALQRVRHELAGFDTPVATDWFRTTSRRSEPGEPAPSREDTASTLNQHTPRPEPTHADDSAR